jgi:hypothetical protein
MNRLERSSLSALYGFKIWPLNHLLKYLRINSSLEMQAFLQNVAFLQ